MTNLLDLNLATMPILSKPNNSPESEASREAANLTGRKNPCSLVYGANEFVCLSVCLFVNHKHNYPDLNYLQGGMNFAAEIFTST